MEGRGGRDGWQVVVRRSERNEMEHEYLESKRVKKEWGTI